MQVEQLPAPPKNWWGRNKGRIAAGALIWVALAIVIGAVNGAGETKTPTAPAAQLGPIAQEQCSRLDAGYQSFKDAGDPNGQAGVAAGVSAINDMAVYSDDPVLQAEATQWLAASDAGTSQPAFDAILAECGISP